jgi:radial spoke head protein 1
MGKEDQKEFEFKIMNSMGEEIPTLENFSGFVPIQYSNGDVYKGNIKEGKRTGEAIYKYKSGANYEGNFCEDEFDRIGKLSYPSGEYYKGYFKNSKKEGEGMYYYKNGNSFSGIWENGVKNGFGTFIKNTNTMR